MSRQGDVSHAFTPAQEESNLAASVIIPVYNGTSCITDCLCALARQTMAIERYEIIIVDDGSTDEIDAVITKWIQANPTVHCKFIRQTNQGPAAARNRGAQVAHGELLLFTDADCIPVPHWIETFVRAFGESNTTRVPQRDSRVNRDRVSAAMGTYRSNQPTVAAQFAQLEFEERYVHMAHESTIDVVATYSAAFRRTVFSSAEGFDPSFPKANNEDVELSYRLSEVGHRMIFVPAAIVYHPHGATWWDYAQTKLGRAYWRTIVYKRYPGKALKDSYTPQMLKVQIVLAPLCILGLGWFLFTHELQALSLIVPFLLTTVPMARLALQKHQGWLALWVPWGLWLRSIVFGMGVAAAILFGNRNGHAVESALQK
ncbi:MAG: glycosyltransferase [Caldilineaceae bacterium]